jgi:hypothetical protein
MQSGQAIYVRHTEDLLEQGDSDRPKRSDLKGGETVPIITASHNKRTKSCHYRNAYISDGNVNRSAQKSTWHCMSYVVRLNLFSIRWSRNMKLQFIVSSGWVSKG